MKVSELTSGDLQRLTLELRKLGNSNGTINRKLAALSRMLTTAVEGGLLDDPPKIRRLKEREHRTRWLSFDEERSLFAALEARDPLIRQFCIFLVETGLRVGEAQHLRWSDVKLREGVIAVRGTKGDLPRTVPMTDAALEVVKRRSGGAGPWSDIAHARLRYIWDLAKKDAGLDNDEDVVPHVLRHTCASRLIQNGAGLLTVQKWLGHKQLSMTLRYAHLAQAQMEAARDVLDKLRGAEG